MCLPKNDYVIKHKELRHREWERRNGISKDKYNESEGSRLHN